MRPSAQVSGGTVAVLKRLARKPEPVERCGLCDVPLAPDHRHLIEPNSRRIECACTACALLFENQTGRYRLVPRDAVALPGFAIDDLLWEALGVPIGLAFFFHNSAMGRTVALYPSPGGATEAELSLDSWQDVVAQNRSLQRLQPDVEALLVNRIGSSREYFIAPIDQCYALVGIIRRDWRGFTGGDEAWQKIGEFFAALRRTARAERQHA